MKKNNFFYYLFFVSVILLCSIAAHAGDLITQQITLNVDKAGSLSEKIGNSRLPLVTNLKLTGQLNGNDIYYLRSYGTEIRQLDLEEVDIYDGAYYYTYYSNSYKTADNTIGGYMFSQVANGKERTVFRHLSSILLPKSLTTIDDYAFADCDSLKSIVIPYGVTTVGHAAFSGCSSLNSVSISNSVQNIGTWAFSNCTSLESITLPESVTEIGWWTFNGCTALTYISLSNNLKTLPDQVFSGCISLSNITIPTGITKIEGAAFKGCSSLISITIPSNVTDVGGNTFIGCSSLRAIYLTSSTPPSYSSDTYDSQITVYIPQGSYADYFLSNWGSYKLVEYDVTSIESLDTPNYVAPKICYSVDGHRLNGSSKGICIIRMSDGTIKKLVVR